MGYPDCPATTGVGPLPQGVAPRGALRSWGWGFAAGMDSMGAPVPLGWAFTLQMAPEGHVEVLGMGLYLGDGPLPPGGSPWVP